MSGGVGGSGGGGGYAGGGADVYDITFGENSNPNKPSWVVAAVVLLIVDTLVIIHTIYLQMMALVTIIKGRWLLY